MTNINSKIVLEIIFFEGRNKEMIKYGLLVLSVLSCLGASTSAAAINTNVEDRCHALNNLHLDNARVVNTEIIVDSFSPSSKLSDTLRGATTEEIVDLPQICRVELTIQPTINVEIWLPTNWNQRLQSIGGGGYAGFIPYDKLAEAVKHGYVAASTDTGHTGNLMDGKFVLKDRKLQNDLLTDFAYRSVHEMTVKTKQIIMSYYGQAANYAYWNGCSTGGRQGLMEAQKYPDDYDGLYIAAPAIHWDKFVPAELWPQVVMQEELGRPFEEEKLEKVRKMIIELADEKDGINDGLVSDPTTLFVNQELLINAGLDDDEIRALQKIWQGPTDSNGKFLWFGIEPTAPLDVLASSKGPFPIPVDYLKYWVKKSPNFDWRRLGYRGFENYFNESVELFRPIMGTDNPDLTEFKRLGGKMIIWHGLNDRLIAPKGTIQYYNNVWKMMGGYDSVDDFLKLYLAPGVDHCNGGDGPDKVNGFESMVVWVEKKQAPTRLIAQKIEDGEITIQRPLCQYPQKTIYKGEGDTNNPENFICQ